ncbi:MAG: ABC transporter permease subunit [Defluviitaleaceae bacterium]|nr:ABC transporter permease subunit [Defluviitaleaceae bacterium]MCL2835926.1 ABC transporter permease subunit [Defluviitaleaceae bacterium]
MQSTGSMIVPKKLKSRRFIRRLKREKTLWLISGVALAWLFIFAYVPMLGIVTAFFNYIPGRSFADLDFVGLRYFREFFSLPDFMQILRNTLVISGLNLSVGFAAPIIFALLLNEIVIRPFKRVVQTVSYLPYFVSWVVVASIMFTLLSANGTINEVLISLGLIDSVIPFLNRPSMFWGIMIIANIWKNVGWTAIIYLSAIAGVDQELYQAGAVDGLGRLGRVWHITLPGIRPTIILLFILGIGNLLNTGFEYQLLVGTPMTRDVYEVVDTYVFRYGIGLGRYSFAVAVGLLKSVIGFSLVIGTNYISKKLSDISII